MEKIRRVNWTQSQLHDPSGAQGPRAVVGLEDLYSRLISTFGSRNAGKAAFGLSRKQCGQVGELVTLSLGRALLFQAPPHCPGLCPHLQHPAPSDDLLVAISDGLRDPSHTPPFHHPWATSSPPSLSEPGCTRGVLRFHVGWKANLLNNL